MLSETDEEFDRTVSDDILQEVRHRADLRYGCTETEVITVEAIERNAVSSRWGYVVAPAPRIWSHRDMAL